MRKKLTCKVCGARFVPSPAAKYLAQDSVPPLRAIVSETAQVFECFDCSACGCQNAVNVRMPQRKECVINEQRENV